MRRTAHHREDIQIFSDQPQAAAISGALLEDGFSSAVRGISALKKLNAQILACELIIFLGVAHRDAWNCINKIRHEASKPTIAIFGPGTELERIVSLEIGADDAFDTLSVEESLAKIRSIVRRLTRYSLDAPAPCVFGGFCLNLDQRCLLAPDNRNVHLTTREFNILRVFATRPNRVFSRDQVLDLIGGDGACIDRAIDTLVSRLRRKLRSAGAQQDHIITVRGEGYQLVR